MKRVREGEPISVTATAPSRHRWSSLSLEVNRCRVLAARATSATATPQIRPPFLWGFLPQIPPPTSPSFLYSSFLCFIQYFRYYGHIFVKCALQWHILIFASIIFRIDQKKVVSNLTCMDFRMCFINSLY